MKYRLLAGLVTAGALALPAAAADVNANYGYGYAPAAATPMSWTGFFIGANAGYSWGTAGAYSPGGFLGGLQAGYNWQFAGSPFVVGIESDFDWGGISDGPYTLSYLGMIRARVGFAFERILAYGTLGFAYGSGQYEVFGLSNSQTQTGWTIGLGAEFALDRNWSVRGEYAYVDLGSSNYNSLTGPASLGFDGNILRGGVNYRF